MMANGTCCWCMVEPATEAHHVRYSDDKGPVAGREIPGRDVFGVCSVCHDTYLHSKRYWRIDHLDPINGNRNTEEAISRLEFGYNQLTQQQEKA